VHAVTVTAPTVNNAPTAAFTPPTCTTGQPCQFTDGSTDSDGTVSGWSWTFGDPISGGNSSNVRDPSHVYVLAGDYTVSLTVTDDDGATNTVSHLVTIQ